MTDLLFLSSKITVDGDYSHETGRQLLLGRKAMTNLNSVLKSITLPTKVHIVKAMVFQVVTSSCETWTFVSKVVSLLLNMLSKFVIVFLPRSKNLSISWLQSLSTVILDPKKIKSVTKEITKVI